MTTETPINISLTHTSKNENNYNEFKEYIIINNLDLQKQVLEWIDKVNNLQNELNEKEKEEDKHDAQTRYMRGLVINLNEIKNGYKNLFEQRKYLLNSINKQWRDAYKKTLNYNIKTITYSGCWILILLISQKPFDLFNYYFESTLYLTIVILFGYLMGRNELEHYKHIKHNDSAINKRDKELNDNTKSREQELAKLEESTLSLENWIYEV
tara:strand:+ start:4591 stop:5223 length:633 start_codon:yes stop_codon:yes gene_type:complete